MGRVHLNCETPGSSWSISCKKVDFLQVVLFRCRLRFLLLVFVELTDVNMSKAIRVIRRAKKYVQIKQDALKVMYNSLVLPYFDYCSLVWNNCSQTLKTKVSGFKIEWQEL